MVENIDKLFEAGTEEEKRQEIIRLRDNLLDEIAAQQRVMAEYVKKANACTEMLREMDRKGVKSNEPQAQKDITFDDGDDWDWGW